MKRTFYVESTLHISKTRRRLAVLIVSGHAASGVLELNLFLLRINSPLLDLFQFAQMSLLIHLKVSNPKIRMTSA